MKILTTLSYLLLCFAFACNQSGGKSDSKKNESSVVDKKDEMIVYYPKLITNKLPDQANEQSGMIWHDDLIWIINDSDCAPSLYAYDVNGELVREAKLEGERNVDWESLAEDDENFYIGDFGNNYGVRKDLRVLKVSKSKITRQAQMSVVADEITFEWADQLDFKAKKHKHNYDCEAFLSYGDSLYFFTKNWADLKTRLYAMPKQVGHYKLTSQFEFDSDLLITGADINSDGSLLALVGYKDFRSYMFLFAIKQGGGLLEGKHIKLYLESLGSAQTEGVVFDDNNVLYISSEETNQPQALYQIEWETWKEYLK